MKFHKYLLLSAGLLVAVAAGTSTLYAQATTAEENQLCRIGLYNPFVGAYVEKLNITNVGTDMSLIVLNQGGTLTETDGVDLTDPTRNPSPGYGSWKALDCQHYVVTINKIIYDSSLKQFQTTVLEGSAVLSEDGNSWTATLNQNFFDSEGNTIRTDTVTGTATRIKPGSTE